MSFDVGRVLARLREEYGDVTETSRANRDAVMAPDGRYFVADEPARAQDWAWRVLPAIDLGIRDEHDLELVLTALGWTESSPAWGRVMGLEERDTDPGGVVLPARQEAGA